MASPYNHNLLVHEACCFLTSPKDLTKVDSCLFSITKSIASDMFINFNKLVQNISALSVLIREGELVQSRKSRKHLLTCDKCCVVAASVWIEYLARIPAL